MNEGDLQPRNLLADHSKGIQLQPGSVEELRYFKKNQKGFAKQFELFFPDNLASKTIVVIPSLTLDQQVLGKISGALHYEERLLCLLMLLRMPRTHVIYVTSMPIDPIIIDYYLHLLPGITSYHAKERLTLLSCYDMSPISLTEKILQRRRLMDRIKKSIHPDHVAHIACFNSTEYERTLAVYLGIPIFGCDPALKYWGTKSGSRKVFLAAGVQMPPGVEDIKNYEHVLHAVVGLKDMYPDLSKAVLKLNDGFSGEGNAIVNYPEHLVGRELFDWMQNNFYTTIVPVAKDLSTELFMEKFSEMSGVVEAFIEGEVKMSPSVQCRINPLGLVEIIATHDQVLGGDSGQIYIGAHFPCNETYRSEIAGLGKKIGEELKNKGVLGRFSIDFISVKQGDRWNHYAIEINLRKGGTTHPFLMLEFLTNGHYQETTGLFETTDKKQRYYFTSDNVQSDSYKGLTPEDLIDIAMFHGLHFDSSTHKGVMFHMIGALSQFGKIGVVCIGESAEEAYSFYQKTIEVMDQETVVK